MNNSDMSDGVIDLGSMVSEKAQALIEYIDNKNFVCPLPVPWDKLWKNLPDRCRVGAGWEPPAPLILSAWHFSDEWEKAQRLREHILWADRKNYIDQADVYLRRLADEDWLKWPKEK